MKSVLAAAAIVAALPCVALAAVPVKHFAPANNGPSGPAPPFSSAVQAGDTLYIGGSADAIDPATGKLPVDAKTGAKVVMDIIKKTVETAGYTMNDMVWVQIFASDAKYLSDFNEVYKTYFTGPMPARAFIGAGPLVNGSHFQVMGIAVKSK